MLELKNLVKSYGSSLAINHINLTIRDGEFFSLLGPSGCGKTTLLRMLGGFESPSQGQIFHNGVRIDSLPAHQRQFNMVFQRYALFPHLNVWENVAFGLKMKNTPHQELQSRVEEALALVKMETFSAREIDTLSGGQQQRIALARALINRPKILLLDEPLSALDLKLRRQMQIELLSLQRRLKHTFIFVTHDQEEALTLSDRIAVMNAGSIEQVGTAQEIYEYPKTSFVAEFIGSINRFNGTVQEIRSDAIAISSQRRALWVRPGRDGLRPLPSLSIGTRTQVLIRPEKIKLLKSWSSHSDQNMMEGVLREVLYQGPLTWLQVQLKESLSTDPLWIVSQPNSALTAKKSFGIGDRVFLTWSPEDCILMQNNHATH